jgi:hypothetical protein
MKRCASASVNRSQFVTGSIQHRSMVALAMRMHVTIVNEKQTLCDRYFFRAVDRNPIGFLVTAGLIN